MMKHKNALIQTLVFLSFIGLFFVLHLIIPDKNFSQQENRSLQTLPRFSVQALLSGRYTSSLESYVSDQFPFRDNWTALKARCELLSGKDANNGVYLCAGETLLEGYTAPEAAALEFRANSIRTLAETVDVPVYFALIPSASEIWADKLPTGAPNDSQQKVIADAYAEMPCDTIDLFTPLWEHRDESIFYRTDHHWTTLGAYYGYAAIAESMGFPPVPLDAYTPTLAASDFYGTTYSASGFRWVKPDSIITYVEPGDEVITNYPQGVALPGTLYDEHYLTVKDKYSYFYGGNTPLLTIETGNADAPTLLILRDSYMDSLSPYLFPHFSEIHILDLRYYRTSLHTYIAENDIDQIFVCYSVKNFSEDENIFLAAY